MVVKVLRQKNHCQIKHSNKKREWFFMDSRLNITTKVGIYINYE